MAVASGDPEDTAFEELLAGLRSSHARLRSRIATLQSEISASRGEGPSEPNTPRTRGGGGLTSPRGPSPHGFSPRVASPRGFSPRVSPRGPPPRGLSPPPRDLNGHSHTFTPRSIPSTITESSEAPEPSKLPRAALLLPASADNSPRHSSVGPPTPRMPEALESTPFSSSGVQENLSDGALVPCEPSARMGRSATATWTNAARPTGADAPARPTAQNPKTSLATIGTTDSTMTVIKAKPVLLQGPSGRFRITSSIGEQRLFERMSIQSTGLHIECQCPETRGNLMSCIVKSPIFEAVCGFMIMCNAAFIGLETNMMAHDPDIIENLTVHNLFNIFFTGELILRLWVAGPTAFFCKGDWRWNWLDTLLVLTAVVELVLALIREKRVMAVRLIRLVRLVRTMRLFRALKSVGEFNKMVFALLSSARTLLCSLLILSFVMFFFAVIFTQATTEQARRYTVATDECNRSQLKVFFGSLENSFYSLFVAVSNGKGWHVFMADIACLDPGYAALFILYISIVFFGVLNIVTSIFVESAIMSAQHYKDLIIQEKQSKRELAMRHMREVFGQIDEDGSGTITAREMEFFLQEPALHKYFDALDINAGDTRMLFRLLDKDGSGLIDIDEFCEGCLRLQGAAKSFDIHSMSYQVKHFLRKWSDFTVYCEEKFEALSARMPDERDKAFRGPDDHRRKKVVNLDVGTMEEHHHKRIPKMLMASSLTPFADVAVPQVKDPGPDEHLDDGVNETLEAVEGIESI